ncbi:hypothetical protein [Limnohabitans planktonicus]|uniref:hypothetical protein n=1 Tax=Limnohabitans planktonicus TaxID=540060 RepID=UPI00140210D7|nr:hypothetical protein [Limnohabitans planktonicus]
MNNAITKKMADNMRNRCPGSSLANEVSIPAPRGLSISAVVMGRCFHLDWAASSALDNALIIQSTGASKTSIKTRKTSLF